MTVKGAPIVTRIDAESLDVVNIHKNHRVRWTIGKKLLVALGTLFALAASWLFWSGIIARGVLPHKHPNVLRLNSQCRSIDVPYNNVVNIGASDLEINLGDRALTTELLVRTARVSFPRLVIKGLTSEPYDGESELHVDSSNKGKAATVKVWADKAQDGDGTHLCASLQVTLVLPETLAEFGALRVAGSSLYFKTEGLVSTPFEMVEVTVLEGSVEIDEITTASLVSTVEEGSITVSYLASPYNTSVEAKLETNEGEIRLNAFTPSFEYDDVMKNSIRLLSSDGNIFLGVNEFFDDEEDGKNKMYNHLRHGLQGGMKASSNDEVIVFAKSVKGNILSKIVLNEDQLLYKTSRSIGGKVVAEVSDQFLGRLSLTTKDGSVQIDEKSPSESTIVYKKEDYQTLLANKVPRGRKGNTGKVGNIFMTSTQAETTLSFV
ncbi:hypothetical protein BG004_006251 [Podila humilis]|nr:hypothetical protein BG004_006251 [Podila humilis]